jgi:hypothetical protein
MIDGSIHSLGSVGASASKSPLASVKRASKAWLLRGKAANKAAKAMFFNLNISNPYPDNSQKKIDSVEMLAIICFNIMN